MTEYFPYALRSWKRLNARRAEPVARGCLVRADGGVACLQTWPELGEPDWREALEDFASARDLPISRQAWACCRIDGAARRAGIHLLDGLAVPRSHYTLPWGETEVPAEFEAVKVKAGADAGELRRVLHALRPGLRIRLDFNETLGAGGFRVLWRELGDFHSWIDFVEDPAPYHLQEWSELEEALGCRLAVDRHQGPAPFLRVWKPARGPWAGAGEVVVTSNMDHPIGQTFAAYCAAGSHPEAQRSVCGLVTQHLFDPEDPFVAALGAARPAFPRAPGSGLGFDHLLEHLPWRKW